MTPRVARWYELDPRTLHDVVRLRIDVFVVEQQCPYPELDGRDVDPGTEHVWLDDDSGVVAYLRVLLEPDGTRRVGRVVTRPDARGRGLSAALVASVVDRHGDARLVLDAQTYVAGLYERFGFTATGPQFLEDGIPHVPMERQPGPVAAPAGSAAGQAVAGQGSAGQGSAGQGSAATSSASPTRGPV